MHPDLRCREASQCGGDRGCRPRWRDPISGPVRCHTREHEAADHAIGHEMRGCTCCETVRPGLHRIPGLGHSSMVVAPSLIRRKRRVTGSRPTAVMRQRSSFRSGQLKRCPLPTPDQGWTRPWLVSSARGSACYADPDWCLARSCQSRAGRMLWALLALSALSAPPCCPDPSQQPDWPRHCLLLLPRIV
jgi:hypothetical protein